MILIKKCKYYNNVNKNRYIKYFLSVLYSSLLSVHTTLKEARIIYTSQNWRSSHNNLIFLFFSERLFAISEKEFNDLAYIMININFWSKQVHRGRGVPWAPKNEPPSLQICRMTSRPRELRHFVSTPRILVSNKKY